MLFYDDAGAKAFVSKGIASNDHTWFTVRQIGGKGEHRIKTKFLPVRKTAAEAEADLRAYAKKKGWREEAAPPGRPETDGGGASRGDEPPSLPLPAEVPPDEITAVNALHKKFALAMKKGALFAFEIGKRLREIWGQLEDCEGWPGWCREHLDFDVGTANRYLRVYENFKDNPRALAGMTAAGAVKFLSAPGDKTPAASESETADKQRELPWEPYFELPPLSREVKLNNYRFEAPNSHELYLIRRGLNYPVKIAEVLAPEDRRLKTARKGMLEAVQAALEQYYQEVERVETLEGNKK
jgi:hypothetical protein